MTLIPICRVTALSSRSVGIDDAKIQSNLRWPKITDSRARCYGSLKLGDFVLKIALNRKGENLECGEKMLYLCIVKRSNDKR